MRRIVLTLLLVAAAISTTLAQPLRLAIAGMDHDHIWGALEAHKKGEDMTIVGIWEPDYELAFKYAERYNIPKDIIFNDLGEMLDATKPEGVAAFCSIYNHLKVVEEAAPRGIDVMVEKPLAVSLKHALKIEKLAKEYGIIVMTNYETSWYSTLTRSEKIIESGQIGKLNKAIIYDGHNGPIGINVSKEFEKWLTDPVLNGGGAVIDFGCYGANIMTALQKGEKPLRVYADIRTHNMAVYRAVDDDATIILSYDDNEAIINGSWAWPFGRKDMHLYGDKGYILTEDHENMRLKTGDYRSAEEQITTDEAPYKNGFAYFRDWIRGTITPEDYDVSALENNMTVVKILSAAKRSARSGKSIKIK